jgi:heme oxygenase
MISASSTASLISRMRDRTADLHREAERSGVLASILAGNATKPCYALYLRNLLPAYQQMESALQRHRDRPGFDYLAQPSLHRVGAILYDLDRLTGPDWPADLALLPAGNRYAARVAWAGDGGELLIAHAYVRYLGDLSGGQILRKCLFRLFGSDFEAAAFTEFRAIDGIGGFVAGFRTAVNEACDAFADLDRIVEEAAVAFQMNISISEEVAAFRE